MTKTIYCGIIDHDDVMNWCIKRKKFTQYNQFIRGYSWGIATINPVIYTNNDHFLNGVRLAVREGWTDPDDIKIIYTPTEEYGEDYKSVQPITVKMEKDGHIIYWHKGFFDQYQRELLRLL